MLRFINSHLSIGLRLALVTGVLIVSSGLSAILLVRYGISDLNFAQKEHQEAEYDALIWQALQDKHQEVANH